VELTKCHWHFWACDAKNATSHFINDSCNVLVFVAMHAAKPKRVSQQPTKCGVNQGTHGVGI